MQNLLGEKIILYRPKSLGKYIGYRDITNYLYIRKLINDKEYFIKFNNEDVNSILPYKILIDNDVEDNFVLYIDFSKVVPILDTEVKYFPLGNLYVIHNQNEEEIYVDYEIEPSPIEEFNKIDTEIKKYEEDIKILNENKKNIEFRLKRLRQRMNTWHENSNV